MVIYIILCQFHFIVRSLSRNCIVCYYSQNMATLIITTKLINIVVKAREIQILLVVLLLYLHYFYDCDRIEI